MIPLKHEDIDVFFTEKNLLGEYDKHAERFGGAYPDVKNPGALIDGVKKVMQRCADEAGGNPAHVTVGIWEIHQETVNGRIRKRRLPSDYFISLDNLEEALGEPGYAITESRLSDELVESMSVIEPDRVHWSVDTMENTEDQTRTKYYIGLIYLICENAPGYDQEALPVEEVDLADLEKYLARDARGQVMGQIPEEVQEAAMQQRMAEEERKLAQTAEPSYGSIFAYAEPEETAQETIEETVEEVAAVEQTQQQYAAPWEEETAEQEAIEAEQAQTQAQESYFFDDTQASFEELDLEEEQVEELDELFS